MELSESHYCEDDELSKGVREFFLMGINADGEWILSAKTTLEDGTRTQVVRIEEIAPGVRVGRVGFDGSGAEVAEGDDAYPIIEREGDQVTIEGTLDVPDRDGVNFSARAELPPEPGRPGGC